MNEIQADIKVPVNPAPDKNLRDLAEEIKSLIEENRASGTFDQKPLTDDIYVGFKYFCTDRQTVEGATDGIEIIYKGNGVWVDALGRVVS